MNLNYQVNFGEYIIFLDHDKTISLKYHLFTTQIDDKEEILSIFVMP